MTTRTSLELHADLCRVVEVEVAPRDGRADGDVRVRTFETAVQVSSPHDEFSDALRRLREERHLARTATVTLWGLRSTHQLLHLPPTEDGDLRARAVEEAKEEIALIETDESAIRVALTVGSDVQVGSQRRCEVSLTVAVAAEIARRLEPIEDAGFEVVRVLTPAMALTSIARARRDLTPGPTTMYVALATRATCVAIVRDGVLLLARELPWGYDAGHGEGPFEAQLASELKRSALYFHQTFRTPVESIALCGGIANLRTLTPVLGAALGVGLETLDALTGIDVTSVPDPADVFRADVASLRAAIAAGAEPAPYANLLPETKDSAQRARTVRRYLAAATAAALLVFTSWYGLSKQSESPSRPVLDSAFLDTRVASSRPEQVRPRQDNGLEPSTLSTPAEPPVAAPGRDASRERELAVTSILYSVDRQLALIDGRIARVGDRIGSSRLVDIRPNAVVVESSDGQRRTVELRAPARGRR